MIIRNKSIPFKQYIDELCCGEGNSKKYGKRLGKYAKFTDKNPRITALIRQRLCKNSNYRIDLESGEIYLIRMTSYTINVDDNIKENHNIKDVAFKHDLNSYKKTNYQNKNKKNI